MEGSSNWRNRAACLGQDVATFFPARGGPAPAAKRICGQCPVRLDCLRLALRGDELGVFGGFTRRERNRLVREARKNTKAAVTA